MKERSAPRHQRESLLKGTLALLRKPFLILFCPTKENTSTPKTTLLCGRNKKLFNFYLKNRI